MAHGKAYQITALDTAEPEKVIQTVELLHSCFAGSDRYRVSRLTEELRTVGPPFYRHFFVAKMRSKGEELVIGVGGVKAADWASNTHILYLSAVHPEFRNRGIGRKLVKARVDWIQSTFQEGRILVSTAKLERFMQFGFRSVTKSCDKGRTIMVMEF